MPSIVRIMVRFAACVHTAWHVWQKSVLDACIMMDHCHLLGMTYASRFLKLLWLHVM